MTWGSETLKEVSFNNLATLREADDFDPLSWRGSSVRQIEGQALQLWIGL